MKKMLSKTIKFHAFYAMLLSTVVMQPVWAQDMTGAPPADLLKPAEPILDMAMPAAAAPQIGEPKQMSLETAVRIGVETTPNRGILSNNRRATDEELKQARALYLPSVDLRVDGGFENTKSASTGQSNRNLTRNNAGITLTQMLFDGGATRHENMRQQYRVLSAANRVREADELHALAVVESYLEVTRQRQLLRIAEDNVSQHMTILNHIKDSTSSGKTTMADEQQATARLNAAKADTETTREALHNAEADFVRDVGQSPETLIMPSAPLNALPTDVEQAVKDIITKNQTLAVRSADINVAHEEYLASDSTYYPKVDLQLQAQDGENLSGVRGDNSNSSALLVMHWNLFRGGADVARHQETLYRKAQAVDERAKAARGIENDVRRTWASMIAADMRLREFTSQVEANSQIVRAYLDQFTLNRRTLLDVLDSQNELFVSHSNMVNAQHLKTFAAYRLVALKGDLLQTLSVPFPREADTRTN